MNLRKYVIGLHKQIRRLTSFKVAYQEWSDKTDWVQQSAHWSELGKHRADVIIERFSALKAEKESLRKDAERYRWLGANPCAFVSTYSGKWRVSVGEYTITDWHESRDEAIDAAISSPENPS